MLLETVRREAEEVEKKAMFAVGHLQGLAQGPQSAAWPAQLIAAQHGREKKQPSEWTVDEVVEWLNGKGFGQDVQHKFIGSVTFLFPVTITNAKSNLYVICRAGHYRRCPPRTQQRPSQN
jgi:hypothetical protein